MLSRLLKILINSSTGFFWRHALFSSFLQWFNSLSHNVRKIVFQNIEICSCSHGFYLWKFQVVRLLVGFLAMPVVFRNFEISICIFSFFLFSWTKLKQLKAHSILALFHKEWRKMETKFNIIWKPSLLSRTMADVSFLLSIYFCYKNLFMVAAFSVKWYISIFLRIFCIIINFSCTLMDNELSWAQLRSHLKAYRRKLIIFHLSLWTLWQVQLRLVVWDC